MAAQQKKKQTSGVRNPDRKNGKAPKKHPKAQRTLPLEVKLQRERDAAARAERKALEAEKREENRRYFIDYKAHPQALAMHKIWLEDQKRSKAREAIAKMRPYGV